VPYSSFVIRPDGTLGFGDINLGLLDENPQIAWEFLAEDTPDVRPDQVRGYDALLVLAPRVTAATLEGVGDPQTVGGPEWLAPLLDALGTHAQQYRLTHEGGTDHDWLEAWLATQLGVAPKPRLWEIQ